MGKNEDARIEGEENEKIITNVIQPKIQLWNPENNCIRNPYRGNNKYDGGFSEEAYWYDMRMYLHTKGNSRDVFYVNRWFNGYFERWWEFKLDKKVYDNFNPTGNLAFEAYADSFSRNLFMPSGILKSKAEIWVIRSPTGHYWVMDLQTIRRLCDANDKYVSKRTGEHNEDGGSKVTTLLYCVSLNAIEKEGNYLDKGTDINDIDLEKIIFNSSTNKWF